MQNRTITRIDDRLLDVDNNPHLMILRIRNQINELIIYEYEYPQLFIQVNIRKILLEDTYKLSISNLQKRAKDARIQGTYLSLDEVKLQMDNLKSNYELLYDTYLSIIHNIFNSPTE